jgi:hypothetical protein
MIPPRETTKDLVVGDYVIPAKVYFLSTLLIH